MYTVYYIMCILHPTFHYTYENINS